MCRQVIEHDAHLVGLWIVGVDEFAHTLGEVAGRAVFGDPCLRRGKLLTLRQPRWISKKTNRLAVPLR